MAVHGVGVAQAKPACKHTIATRMCYQYNTDVSTICPYNRLSGVVGLSPVIPVSRRQSQAPPNAS